MECVNGCIHFDGGEIKHHKDCPYYPESLSRHMDELEANQQRLLDALLCVEFISMNQEDLPHNLKTDKERELHSAHNKIYRLSHVARNPSCIAKHDDWEKELQDFIPIAKN